MAMSVRVHCVVKGNRYSPHEAIQAIGGVNADQSRWRLSQQEAIVGIESGKYAFYVERPTGHRVNVMVGLSRYGHKYLKTEADGESPDNLLSLPECP